MKYSKRVMIGVGGFIEWRWKGVGDVADRTTQVVVMIGAGGCSDG